VLRNEIKVVNNKYLNIIIENNKYLVQEDRLTKLKLKTNSSWEQAVQLKQIVITQYEECKDSTMKS